MIFNLLLDSNLARQQRTGGRQVSHDFTINFQTPIYLGSGNYKATHGTTSSFDNNKIRWRNKNEEWRSLIFPNGMYDYSDINSFLQSQTGKDEGGDFIFTRYFDMTIFRVVILMHEDYELDLSEGEFARLLGYDKDILKGKKNFVAARYHKKR